MKRVFVLLSIFIVVLGLMGCEAAASKLQEDALEAASNKIQEVAENVAEAAGEAETTGENSEAVEAVRTGTLKAEYKVILDGMLMAKDRGYAYEGMLDFMVKGDKMKRVMMFGDDGSYTVGEKGGKVFEVTLKDGQVTDKVEVDPDDLFGEYAAGDMLQFYVDRLTDTLYAASDNMKYDEGRGSIIVLTDVVITTATAPSGASATVITVNSYPESMANDKGYEIYVIAEDGLLEQYTLSTPILNSGKPSVETFEFTSRGPIDDAEFSDLD